MGFKPSIYASKIIMVVLSAITAAVILSGALAAAYKFIPLFFSENDTESWVIQDFEKQPEPVKKEKAEAKYDDKEIIKEEPVQKIKLKTSGKKIPLKASEQPGKPAPVVKARLGISNLVPAGIKAKESEDVSKKIYDNLRNLRGNEGVIYIKGDRESKNVNRQLLGRLSRLGSSYVLAVRVVDSGTGDVLYDRTVTIKKDTPVDEKIVEIAREINDVAVIWE